MRTLPQFYINVPALRPGTPGGYALALVAVGVATVLRLAVDPYVVGVPFATFWPAVVLTALISGIGAGLTCVALSAVAGNLFVLAPHLSLYIEGRRDISDLLLFVVLACFCVVLITQLHDAIDREQAERALRVIKERLQLALDTAELGWWQYDPHRLVAAGDARFKEIFDISADEVPIEEIMKQVHPDDAERFWEQNSAMLDPAGPHRASREYRVQGREGEVRWARVFWLAYHEGAGVERRVVNVVGTVQDITEHRECAAREHLLTERLQFALDTAQVGWWRYDPRRLVAAGDARFKEIFDLTADEIHIEEIRKLVHPDDAERFWGDRMEMLDPTGPQRSTHEYRVRRRDGGIRWVRVSWLTQREAAGREQRVVSVLGTVHDITEHKEVAAREHLLARESAHRAKNLISVVDAIAHQTAAKSPADFIERFSDRMQALAANQDLIVRNEWKGVEIKALVHGQLAHFADIIGRRISVDGPRLRVKPGTAQAIGLAVHELATNAAKYGALSTDMGRVDIRWGIDGETFTMSWTERGGPPVSPPQRRGFGAIVIEAMAERSVSGKVDLEYAPSGLVWRLTCPAENALEPPANANRAYPALVSEGNSSGQAWQ